MKKEKEESLLKMFHDWSGEDASEITPIKDSGSNRQYYRLKGLKQSAIGVIGEDKQENRAFLSFSDHFGTRGLNVPEVYKSDESSGMYILEDLGDLTLFNILMEASPFDTVPENIETLYKKALNELIRFQVLDGKDLDYSVCFPRSDFDDQSMQWDLNYFKYYFLKLSNVTFNEQLLENDFQCLIDFLKQADCSYFMYRDFQARNIMVHDDEPWFIDYQGGRRGPLQYDVASLLFQAKADLPFDFREKMLEFYIAELNKHIITSRFPFIAFYYGFVFIRTLQVLGAYGFRGYYEKKPHFVESIQYAIKNLSWLLDNVKLPVDMPELTRCLKLIVENNQLQSVKPGSENLVVEINSFSYIYAQIPEDKSGHGGGFVFDCRGLPNPGRYAEYKTLTGLDKPVIEFLKKETSVDHFNQTVSDIICQAIDTYIERDFDHLMINFGCTGGQHRSVYCAEKLYDKLKNKYNIKVNLNHLMKDRWKR